MYFKYGDKEINHLKNQDPKLGKAIDQLGRIKRRLRPDPFEALINSVVSQQISAKAAETVWNRLLDKAGTITPVNIANMDLESIKSCGMSYRKAQYIMGIGKAAAEGEVDFKNLHKLEDKEIIDKLSSLYGVGVWTAEMLLIFSLHRPDIVSYRDLGIRRGMMNLYKTDNLTKKQFFKYREKYAPYGSVASLYLWELSVMDV